MQRGRPASRCEQLIRDVGIIAHAAGNRPAREMSAAARVLLNTVSANAVEVDPIAWATRQRLLSGLAGAAIDRARVTALQ